MIPPTKQTCDVACEIDQLSVLKIKSRILKMTLHRLCLSVIHRKAFKYCRIRLSKFPFIQMRKLIAASKDDQADRNTSDTTPDTKWHSRRRRFDYRTEIEWNICIVGEPFNAFSSDLKQTAA